MVSVKKLKNIIKYSSFASVLNTNIFASSTSGKHDVTEIKKECEKLVEEIKKINGSCSISIPDNANLSKLTEIKKKLEEEKKNVINQRNSLIKDCESLITKCKELDSQFDKTVDQNDTITNLNKFKGELDKDLKDLENKKNDKDPEKNKENPVKPEDKDPKKENPEKENPEDPKKDNPGKQENPEEIEKKEFDECVELLKNSSWEFYQKVQALYEVSEEQLDDKIKELKPEYDRIINFEKKLKEEGKDEILGENGKTIINSSDLSTKFGYYHLLDDIKEEIKKDKEEKAKKAKEEAEKNAKETAFKERIENLKKNANVEKDFKAFFEDFNDNQIAKIAAREIKEITEENVNKYINLFKEKVIVYFEDEYKIKHDEDFKKYLERIEKYATKFFTEYDNNKILDNNRFKDKFESEVSFKYFKMYFELYIEKEVDKIISNKKLD